MAGDGLALTERDRALLSEVSRFGVMCREQLIRLKFFSSKTRANERLRRLTAAGYLNSKAQALRSGGPRFIYIPGPQLEISRTVRRRIAEASELFVAHQLGMVDIRLAFEQHARVKRWLSEKDLLELSLGVIPDGYIEYVVRDFVYSAFVEYDRGTEPLGRIEQKTRAYLNLAFGGHFERTFGRRYFRTLVITESTRRLDTLSDAVGRISDKVLRITLLHQLSEQGPLASIWRRPGCSSLESLTGA